MWNTASATLSFKMALWRKVFFWLKLETLRERIANSDYKEKSHSLAAVGKKKKIFERRIRCSRTQWANERRELVACSHMRGDKIPLFGLRTERFGRRKVGEARKRGNILISIVAL